MNLLEQIGSAYNKRGKNIISVTGNVDDLAWNERLKRYATLEELLFAGLEREFLCLRLDGARGVQLYNEKDLGELEGANRVYQTAKRGDQKLSEEKLLPAFAASRHQPLASLVLLSELATAVEVARKANYTVEGADSVKRKVRPLCVVVQYVGAILPNGELGKLPELDRQRLVQFLSWASSPSLAHGGNLVILVSKTRAEVNGQVLALPASEAIELALPTAEQRQQFVERYSAQAQQAAVTFAEGPEDFVASTAGLKLSGIEDLLEEARRSERPVGRSDVLTLVNKALEAELGGIIRLNIPGHGKKDVIGNGVAVEVLEKVFKRCDNIDTAVSAVLVSGPNGGGKTFILEAMAAESGRVVIELAGLRGSYFGETDKFFEMLRFYISTYGRIIIMVDEAHTAFGSVHKSDTHETEKRLAGNIIKMMGDPKMRGKVLWCLMTSRPDELDPDVKSRAPIQIPIFDPEGEDRVRLVKEMLGRKKIELDLAEVAKIVDLTLNYSLRDYDNLVRETLARDDKDPNKALEDWAASQSIATQRRMQSLIASQHCSYPRLLPAWIREIAGGVEAEIQSLRLLLGHH